MSNNTKKPYILLLPVLMIVIVVILIHKHDEPHQDAKPPVDEVAIVVTKTPSPLKISESGYPLTEQDISLGIADVTEAEEHGDYILPAMVKLIPREIVIGYKIDAINFWNRISLSPYASRGADYRKKLNPDPFWVGRYEVTLKEFEKYLLDTNQKKEDVLLDGANQTRGEWPVVGVSREDALNYCKWLSKKSGMSFRLPTQEEWQYAASSGYEGKSTPYGDKIPFEYYQYDQYKNYLHKAYELDENFKHDWNIVYHLFHKVGDFKSTRFRLFGLGGNVMEWTYHDFASEIYRIHDSGWYTGGRDIFDCIVKRDDCDLIDLGFRLFQDVKGKKEDESDK